MRIGGVDRRRDRRQHLLEAVLAVLQFGFGFFALGDVARDLGCADDTPLSVAHRRNGQRNVDQRAILPSAHRFEVVDAFPAADARENRRLLVEPIGRDQDGDRPADDLFGLVAEKPLGALVPCRDDAVEVLADDGVVRGFHDRDEMLRRAFGLLARRFVAYPFDGEAELARDRQCEIDLGGAIGVRPVMVDHEFSDQP